MRSPADIKQPLPQAVDPSVAETRGGKPRTGLPCASLKSSRAQRQILDSVSLVALPAEQLCLNKYMSIVRKAGAEFSWYRQNLAARCGAAVRERSRDAVAVAFPVPPCERPADSDGGTSPSPDCLLACRALPYCVDASFAAIEPIGDTSQSVCPVLLRLAGSTPHPSISTACAAAGARCADRRSFHYSRKPRTQIVQFTAAQRHRASGQ